MFVRQIFMQPQQRYDQTDGDNAYLLPTNKLKSVLQPLDNPNDSQQPQVQTKSNPADSELAAEVIRSKIRVLYGVEPDAIQETTQAEQTTSPRSKHQQFMHELSTAGKSVAEIQTAWHQYYTALPDAEKHAVWQEFYSSSARGQKTAAPQPAPAVPIQVPKPAAHVFSPQPQAAAPRRGQDRRTVADIKDQLLNRVTSRSRPARQHFQSLLFGLATGSVVLIILLFGFFNERFLTPFITPSRSVSATPIIIDPGASPASKESKIIIPKINVEIPVVYDEPSVEEGAIQQALERGVVHYATTPKPGELGNSVIFGHSSNNILNKGKYKFAFVLLNKLSPGDTFYLTYNGTRYAYKVFDKKVVTPDDFSVLEPVKGKPAVATLITCDPPGTSINRLVVTAEQITPDPSANVASSTESKPAAAAPAALPSNAPSLWSRLTGWITS